MPAKGPVSEASLRHGGWGWRPQLQEWHKLVHVEQTRQSRNRPVLYTATLLRRNRDRRLIKSLSKKALEDFNLKHGFTYGEKDKGV